MSKSPLLLCPLRRLKLAIVALVAISTVREMDYFEPTVLFTLTAVPNPVHIQQFETLFVISLFLQ